MRVENSGLPHPTVIIVTITIIFPEAVLRASSPEVLIHGLTDNPICILYGFQNQVRSVKPVFRFWVRPKPVFGFGFGFGSHIIAFTANLRGGVEVKDGADRSVLS